VLTRAIFRAIIEADRVSPVDLDSLEICNNCDVGRTCKQPIKQHHDSATAANAGE
jgi:hypothetical protein